MLKEDKEECWSLNDSIWNIVWKISSPQRVRLILKQRLLTNFGRVRKEIGQDESYQRFGHNTEDALHILRDYL